MFCQNHDVFDIDELLDSLLIESINDPSNSFNLKTIGDIYASKGKYDESLIYLNRAINLDSAYLEAYYSRGYLRYLTKDYEGSIFDYIFILNYCEILNCHLVDEHFYLNLGSSFEALDSLAEAYKCYNKSKMYNEYFPKAYYNAGLILIKTSEYDKAILDLNKAVELDPFDADSYFNRGYIKYQLGLFSEAIEDYKKSHALNTDYFDAYKWIGLCYIKLGKKESACESLKIAKSHGVEIEKIWEDNCK